MAMQEVAPFAETLEQRKVFVSGIRRIFGVSESVSDLLSHHRRMVSTEPPQVRSYNEVTMVPLSRLRKGVFSGGAYCNGQLIDALGWYRGANSKESLVRPVLMHGSGYSPQVIDEAWFGGFMVWHFGHFLVESLARLAGTAVRDSDLPIVFFAQRPSAALQDYMTTALYHLGIDTKRVFLIHEPVRVRVLLAQDPYITIRGSVSRPDRLPLCGSCVSSRPREGLIYLSRRKLSDRREVRGEALLEDVILKNGGEIFYPEQHDFSSQYEKIARSSLVVAMEGSALHAVILQKDSVNTLCVSKGPPVPTFFLIDEVVFGDSNYLLLPESQRALYSRESIEITEADAKNFSVCIKSILGKT